MYAEKHPAGKHIGEPTQDVYRTVLSAEKRIGVPLPLYKGRITCSTCHDPHQSGVLKVHSLLEKLPERGSVRAGYRELLCTGCHPGE